MAIVKPYLTINYRPLTIDVICRANATNDYAMPLKILFNASPAGTMG